jgi:hypothetical protein
VTGHLDNADSDINATNGDGVEIGGCGGRNGSHTRFRYTEYYHSIRVTGIGTTRTDSC